MQVKDLYDRIPVRLRLIVWPLLLLVWLLRHLNSCVPSSRHLRLEVWIIEGEEKNSGMPLSILYAGNEINKKYLSSMIFGASLREDKLGQTWLWNIHKEINRKGKDCSLVFIRVIKPIRKLLRIKDCHYIPVWVSGEADIPAVPDSRSLKRDLHKIQQHSLWLEDVPVVVEK